MLIFNNKYMLKILNDKVLYTEKPNEIIIVI